MFWCKYKAFIGYLTTMVSSWHINIFPNSITDFVMVLMIF